MELGKAHFIASTSLLRTALGLLTLQADSYAKTRRSKDAKKRETTLADSKKRLSDTI